MYKLENINDNKINEFKSQKNKALLWNIMYEGGFFKDISSQHLDNVKRDFETKLEEISNNNNNNNIISTATLTQLNKNIIGIMKNELDKYKIKKNQNNLTEPLRIQDIQDIKLKQFNNNFEKKKNEFDELFKRKEPDEIDFSDRLDEPIGNEINYMLESAIAKREKELNIVLDKQNIKVAEEWINKDNDDKEKKVKFEEPPEKPQEKPPEKPQEKTHEKPVDIFLSKLKINDSDNKSIIKNNNIKDNYSIFLNIKEELNNINDRLSKLETIQREILEYITKK